MLAQLLGLHANSGSLVAASLGQTGSMIEHANYLSFGSPYCEISKPIHQTKSPEYRECVPYGFLFLDKVTKYSLNERKSLK